MSDSALEPRAARKAELHIGALVAALVFAVWLGVELLAPETPATLRVSESSEVRRATSLAAPPAAARTDALRVLVRDAATGVRIGQLAVVVSWVERTTQGISTGTIARGRPTGDEPELLIPRKDVEECARRNQWKGAIEVALEAPFEPPVMRTLPLEPWPSDPVELLAPPFGYVGFRLEDEAGDLIDASGSVFIEREEQSAMSFEENPPRPVALRHGEVEAVPCGLGLQLGVHGHLPDRRQLEELRISGPTKALETRWIPLHLAATQPLLLLRLLDPEHRPLANQQIEAHVLQAGSTGGVFGSSPQCATDAEGRLRLPLWHSSGEQNLRCVLAIVYSTQSERWTGCIDLSHDLAAGETALGDLVLAPEPLVASGRVVDERGEGVSFVSVNVSLVDPPGSVRLHHFEEVRCDRNGEFALHSPYPFELARLTVYARDYLRFAPVDLPAGSKDVVLRLARAASARGSIKLPPGMNPSSILVTALQFAAGADRPGRWIAAEDGTFSLTPVIPGSTTILFHHDSGALVGEVNDVELRAGEECCDPRLQNVELCTGWRVLALRIIDAESKPLASLTVGLRCEGSGQHLIPHTTDLEGRLFCWMPPSEGAWKMYAEGRASARVVWSPEEQEVRLLEGLRVILPIEATLVPPFGGLLVQMVKDGLSNGPSVDVVDGVAELVLPEPGRYRLHIAGTVRSDESELTMLEPLELDPPYEVDIAADAKRLPTCRISEDVLRDAANKWR